MVVNYWPTSNDPDTNLCVAWSPRFLTGDLSNYSSACVTKLVKWDLREQVKNNAKKSSVSE